MPDRSWEHGLHQLIEAKEGCASPADTTTLARISYQRFFRRYLRLAGMTGTAREVAPASSGRSTGSPWSASRRTARSRRSRPSADRVYARGADRWRRRRAACARHPPAQGRPDPDRHALRRGLGAAERAARRGRASATACSMPARTAKRPRSSPGRSGPAGSRWRRTWPGAGRTSGSARGSREAGGLHVIATERHDARRIDRQLFGRCGAPGRSRHVRGDRLPRGRAASSATGVSGGDWRSPSRGGTGRCRCRSPALASVAPSAWRSGCTRGCEGICSAWTSTWKRPWLSRARSSEELSGGVIP